MSDLDEHEAGISDEWTRIDEIERRLRSTWGAGAATPGITLGIGDDAAILEGSRRPQVLSVDASVENVHFRRDFAPLRTLGRRALVAAASDLAAMGARGRCALLSLALPPDLADDVLYELVDGLGEAARELSLPIVGGNLSAGAQLAIHSTVVGELVGEPLRRAGACVGDGIFVTGTVGSAALGLELLLRGQADRPDAAVFVEAWRRPHAELTLGQRLCGVASAAIDLSDGLMQDLGHICRASSVGAHIEVASLPLAPHFGEGCASLGLDATRLALSGGEQYTLIFTAPASAQAVPGTRIGTIVAGAGAQAFDATGRRVELRIEGYGHFAVRGGSSG